MSQPSTALAPTSGDGALAPAALGGYAPEQIELLKRTVAAGTSDDEFALFVEVCRATGLNPFQRQVYAIVRQESYKDGQGRWQKRPKMTIQTGIDGYRLIAARTGCHAGTTDAEFGPADAKGNPEWARVTALRLITKGHVAEFVATARWSEYVQTDREGKPQGLWAKMPHTMLAKCAEALALRKAFPAELSGVYTREEMMQAEVDETPARPVRRPARFPGESVYAGPEAVEEVAPIEDADAEFTEPAEPQAAPLFEQDGGGQPDEEHAAAVAACEAAMVEAGVNGYGRRSILGAKGARALADLPARQLRGIVEVLRSTPEAATGANANGYVAAAVAAIERAAEKGPRALAAAVAKAQENVDEYVAPEHQARVLEAIAAAEGRALHAAA